MKEEPEIYILTKNPYLFRQSMDRKIIEKFNQNRISYRLNVENLKIIDSSVIFRSKNENLEIQKIYSDMIIVSTGYIPNPIHHNLPLIESTGYIKINANLQVQEFPFIFAAGDCCQISNYSRPYLKGGVNSYFSGPILAHNIKAYTQKLKGNKRKFP